MGPATWVVAGAFVGAAAMAGLWVSVGTLPRGEVRSSQAAQSSGQSPPSPSSGTLTESSAREPAGGISGDSAWSEGSDGKLGKPFGTVVKLRGVVFTDGRKAESGVPWLSVRSIDGVTPTAETAIALHPFYVGWGASHVGGYSLPTLDIGGSFELEGFESGEFVGVPDEAYRRVGIAFATTGFFFRREFMVISAKKIDPLPMSPADTNR
jgi:hypothetical protein